MPSLPGTPAERRRSLLLLGLALGLAALPLVGLVRRLPAAEKEDYSIGDLAIIELSVVEASHGERLVGQASRFGFYQVGPAHLYLQVPLYRLFGHRRFTLSLTCLLVNWAALLGVLYALGRWFDSGATLLVAPLVAVPYFGYYESSTLFNYWGQYLIVLPAALFLLSAAAVATGRARVWPLLLALASFLVQGYGSTLPPVAAVLAATAAVVAWGATRTNTDGHGRTRTGLGPRPRGFGRGASVSVRVLSLLVLALFWCGTAIDELTRAPGNLSRMVAHYTSGAPRARPPAAAVVESLSCHLAAPWLRALWRLTVDGSPRPGQVKAAEGLAALLAVLLAASAWVGARRGQRYGALVSGLCLLAVAAAFAAARQLDGDVVPYVFFWLSAVGAVGWMASLGVLGGAAAAGLAARRGWKLPALPRAAWLLALAAALAGALAVRPIPIPQLGDPSVGAFAASLERRLAGQGLAARPVRLVSHDFAWPWSLGLLIQLDQRGHRVSIANVQGTTDVPELQGLSRAWMTPLPGSVEVDLFDRDPGPLPGFAKILCQTVLPLDATKPQMCLYGQDGK